MSKILNRPMFRGGGRVSSYNTGITSGLGYARGGQVPPKRGLVDGPGGYAGAPLGVPIFLPKPVAGVPMVIPQAGVPATITGGGGGITGGGLLRGGSLARYLPEMALPFAPTAGIAALLNPETESEKEAMKALEEGVGLSGEAVDPDLYQALSKEVGKTRAAEDRVFSEGSTGILQRIYDTLNPPTSEVLRRLKERSKEEPLMNKISKFFTEPVSEAELTYRTEAEKQAVIDRLAAEEKAKLEKKEKKKDLVTQPTGKETIVEPEKSNADVINEYMDMFKSVLGTDQDELTRQKYLELAKFGTNLLAQGGGKRGLMEKIGAAGTQSLEGLSKIMAQERASDKQIKLAAIQAAMKEMEPGTLGKSVKDLKRLIPKLKGESNTEYNARLTNIAQETGTGAATRYATAYKAKEKLAEGLVKDEIVSTDTAGGAAAETITSYKIPLRDIRKDVPGTPKEDKKYYVRKDGTIYRFNAKNPKNSPTPGEPGF